MERDRSSESTERGPRTNKPRIRRSLRKFVTYIHGTAHRQELFWQMTHLFHDFNRARSYIREEQISIWVDYVMSCQSTNRSKAEIVRNCKAIESQYLALQRKQSTLGLIFMSTFHVVLDAVSGSRTHFEALEKVKTGMIPVFNMCSDM